MIDIKVKLSEYCNFIRDKNLTDKEQMKKLIEFTNELILSIKENADANSNHPHFGGLTKNSIILWTYNEAQYNLKDILKVSTDFVNDDNIDLNKLSEIKLQGEFLENLLETSEKMEEKYSKENNFNEVLDDSIEVDPYKNFRWGGLSGEESYNGFLNTD